MFAAPRFLLFVVAGVAALPAPASASPYTDTVDTAVFNFCPGLRNGWIAPGNPTELTRLRFFRAPELEEDWSDAEDGAPYVFRYGRGAGAVTLGWWPGPQLCSVGFQGSQAEAAAARVKARLARQPAVYQPVPAAQAAWEGGRREAWRVAGRAPSCLAIDTPGRGGEALSYEVSLEPLPPRNPAITLSACAEGNRR